MFKNCKINGIGINPESYHSNKKPRGSLDYVISPSGLKAFADCPARWLAGYEPPDSDAKRFGGLLDQMVLTPESFQNYYAITPAQYTDYGMECPECHSVTDAQRCKKCDTDRKRVAIEKKWNANATTCTEWEKAQGERVILSLKEHQNALDAALALRKDEAIKAFLEASDKQLHVVGEYHDAATGLIIPVQCLIDAAPRSDTEFRLCLGDLKTTRSAHKGVFARYCYQRGYHVQAAFDLALFNAATGEKRENWIFILSENFAPWQTGRRILKPDNVDPMRDEGMLGLGRASYLRDLKRYAHCLKTGKWDAYDEPEMFTEIIPESWMSFAETEKMMESNYHAALDDQDQPENPDLIP